MEAVSYVWSDAYTPPWSTSSVAGLPFPPLFKKRRLTVIVKTTSWLVLWRPLNVSPRDRHFFMSHSFPFGTGVQILDTTTTKTLLVRATVFTFVGEMHTQHGGIFTSAIKRENGDVFAAAGCVWIVHWVSPFSSFDWNGPVQFDRSEEGRKKYLNTIKTKGLAVSKSALCLVQFKSKDNQECLFDNSIYNALFWSPEPPKQRQIGFKQVI